MSERTRTGVPALLLLAAGILFCASCAPVHQDSATFDKDGTANVTRVIPEPSSISPESQKWLASLDHPRPQTPTLAEQRASTDEWRRKDSAEARRIFPVNVEEKIIAGVRTDIITPLETPEANRNRVLINLHGGGFITGCANRQPGQDESRVRCTTGWRRKIPFPPQWMMSSRFTRSS